MLKDPSDRLRRAIKENNLFLVKRIIERTDDIKPSRSRFPARIDMRNPDPGPGRYTSLAWAAAYGHEEIFDYLLNAGHDDEELSRDAENNTILILLAGITNPLRIGGKARPNKVSEYDLQDTALRMARNYYERFPFLIDWSNIQGKTTLHVAATKGNEKFVRMFLDLGADFDLPDLQGNTPLHYASAWNHVSIIQLLIERGCQFAARNNEGFTASDYAFSMSTMATLQETARLQFENNKKARRNIFAQAAARGSERRVEHGTGTQDAQEYVNFQRLRSGSGGNHKTASSPSDGTDLDTANSLNHFIPFPNSPHRQTHQPSGSTSSAGPPLSRQANIGHPVMPSQPSQQSIPLTSVPSGSTASSSSNLPTTNQPGLNPALSALSPVASRMRDRDADAIAEYLKRNRSGSDGARQKELAPGASNQQLIPGAALPPSATAVSSTTATSPSPGQANVPLPSGTTQSNAVVNPSSSTVQTLNDDTENRDSEARFASPPLRPIRRLRPSNSSASLRPTGIIGMPVAPVSGHSHSNSTTVVPIGGGGVPSTLDLIDEALVDLNNADLGSNISVVSASSGTRPLEIRPKNSRSLTSDHNGPAHPGITSSSTSQSIGRSQRTADNTPHPSGKPVVDLSSTIPLGGNLPTQQSDIGTQTRNGISLSQGNGIPGKVINSNGPTAGSTTPLRRI